MMFPWLRRALVTGAIGFPLALGAQAPAKKPARSVAPKAPTTATRPLAAAGPSLEETQAFIKEKMETWGKIVKNLEPDRRHPALFKEDRKTIIETRIKFETDFIIIEVSNTLEYRLDENFGDYSHRFEKTNTVNLYNLKIDKIDIKSIFIDNSEKCLIIPFDNNSKSALRKRECATPWRRGGMDQPKNYECENWVISNDNTTIFRFYYNDLAQIDRLLTAFKHLVELHGGKPSPF